MKKLLFVIAAMLCLSNVEAQLNMTLRSTVTFNQGNLNDVWGWVDEETGKEYAIVGRTNGTSVVEVTDPDNPVDVGFFPGLNTTWRDIKTWGDYAYVTNESGLGVAVLHLGDLPEGGELTGFNWEPNIPGLGQLNTCHNIYIDEFGYAYLAGCNLNSGGMLIVDVFSNPGQPEFVAAGPSVYSHDVYTRDNKMYSSEIFAGVFTIYDVEDKQNITVDGAQPTPFEFTHNAWLNDAGDVLFTTDELADAPIGAYDISDPTDIEELDQFLPLETLGAGVIPHNVHVWQDWLIISYYSDGGIVVDASEPDNLIEVGNWDTFLGGDGGFNGAWGAYPFLPSETILLTDITNGLFVCTPTYVRASRIEGMVTDINSGAAIPNATIEINAEQLNATTTDFTGDYKTGIAAQGTFNVTCSASGYLPQTIEVELVNGTVLIQDFQLGQLPSFAVSGLTLEEVDGSSLANSEVVFFNEEFTLRTTSDENGNFSIAEVPQGSYTVGAGKWGYIHDVQEDFEVTQSGQLTLELSRGYMDDFLFDFGWSTSGNASTGQWEWGVPIGTQFGGQTSNPGADLNSDFGDLCYVTGNGGGGAGDDDVDDGTVILTSPVFDLSEMNEPQISYSVWFFNSGGNGSPPNDELEVTLSNGTETVTLETVDNSFSFWRPVSEFTVSEFIEPTDNMRITFTTSDGANTGHLVEAAVDDFRVTDLNPPSAIIQPVDFTVELTTTPNPFPASANLRYVLDTDYSRANFAIYNQLGQVVETIAVSGREGAVEAGKDLNSGIYFVQLEVDGALVATEKIVKSK